MHGLFYDIIRNALWINIVHNFPVIYTQSSCKKITANIQEICNECEINAKWLAINLQSFGAIKQKMRITSLIKQKLCLASAPEDTPKLCPCRPAYYGLRSEEWGVRSSTSIPISTFCTLRTRSMWLVYFSWCSRTMRRLLTTFRYCFIHSFLMNAYTIPTVLFRRFFHSSNLPCRMIRVRYIFWYCLTRLFCVISIRQYITIRARLVG